MVVLDRHKCGCWIRMSSMDRGGMRVVGSMSAWLSIFPSYFMFVLSVVHVGVLLSLVVSGGG